jgi:hypothetical protein
MPSRDFHLTTPTFRPFAMALLALKRKLSFPVSRMWQWCVRRSSKAVVILASPNADVRFLDSMKRGQRPAWAQSGRQSWVDFGRGGFRALKLPKLPFSLSVSVENRLRLPLVGDGDPFSSERSGKGRAPSTRAYRWAHPSGAELCCVNSRDSRSTLAARRKVLEGRLRDWLKAETGSASLYL